MKYFCIIREKIAYMDCVIQRSMFYSFHLFLSILLCNVDSALVADSTAVFYQNTPIRNFLKVFLMITLAPRQKILSQIALHVLWPYFRSIKSKQNHSSYCQAKESPAVGDEQHAGTRKVRPQRVAARCQKELLCAMAFQGCLFWAWRNVRGFLWTNVTKCDGGG